MHWMKGSQCLKWKTWILGYRPTGSMAYQDHRVESLSDDPPHALDSIVVYLLVVFPWFLKTLEMPGVCIYMSRAASDTSSHQVETTSCIANSVTDSPRKTTSWIPVSVVIYRCGIIFSLLVSTLSHLY